MAKSLRSKSKLQARAVKRTDPKSAFKIAEDARMAKITQRLATRKSLPKVSEEDALKDGEDAEIEEADAAASADGTADDSAAAIDVDAPKVSTSGPRTGRHQATKHLRKKSTNAINGKAGKGDRKRKHSSASTAKRPPLGGPGRVGGGGRSGGRPKGKK